MAERTETVVLVHGIWMTGLEMSLLRYRIGRCGYRTRLFRYPSVRRSPIENAVALSGFLQRLGDGKVHLLGHSLGGLVICHLLADSPTQNIERVVMLSSPLRGSALARRLARSRWTRWLLGRSIERGLLGDLPACVVPNGLGMIAGTQGFGIGWLFGGSVLPRPNDGTVALEETEHPAVTDRLIVPHGHFALLFAREVADATCGFLRHGRF